MELYDKKIIRCYKCGIGIGEIDIEGEAPAPKCGKCADPFPMIKDKAFAIVSKSKDLDNKSTL